MTKLAKDEINTRLKDLPGWKYDDGELERKFKFGDFAASMEFVNAVAALAEQAEHHPDISIKYDRVKLTLSTHSEGGVTDKDFALAEKIDAAAAQPDTALEQQKLKSRLVCAAAHVAAEGGGWALVEQQTTDDNPWSSPRIRQIINWTALGLVTLLFVVPRVSPYDGLNAAINDLNFIRRFSEWLIGKTEDLFEKYGYYVVFFGVLAENSMFLGLLVPGAIILILGGLSAENGSINLWLVLALGIAATIIGDTISYAIGRLGWAKFMEKGAMGKALDRVREPVESNSAWIILGYHFAGYSRVVGPVAAGLFQIPYRRWAPLDYAGGTAWVIVFTMVGFILGLAGVEFGDTKSMVNILEIALFVIFVAVVVLAFARFYQGKEGASEGPRETVVVPVEPDDR